MTSADPGLEGPVTASSDTMTDSYLASLLSYSVETLSQEPENLKKQEEALQQEATETAHRHYQGFIEAAVCFHDMRSQVYDVRDQLSKLAEEISGLQGEAAEFASAAQAHQEQHAQSRSMLAQQGPLLELLETPQLIDTCIRTHNYDEALSLIAFLQRAAAAAPRAPVATHLAAQATECRRALQQQLLEQLSGTVTLSECLQCVSYLRRLATFSEAGLRLRFLQCREHWLQGTISNLSDSNTAEYLRQLTDANRLHLFDIVMQYRAIFTNAAADDSTLGLQDVHGQQDGKKLARVLFSWAQHRVQAYVDQVQQLLPLVADGAALTSVLEACAYAGRSLARVGLDLRPLLEPAVTSAVRALLQRNLAHAGALFCSSLESHKWVAMPLAQPKGGEARAPGDPGEALLRRAHGLLSHPPLAVLLNGVITAFNAIRGNALMALCAAAAQEVEALLQDSCALLANVPIMRKLGSGERAAHLEACRAMVDTACPLVLQLFKQAFTSAAPALPDTGACAVPVQELLASIQSTEPRQAAGSSTPASERTGPGSAPSPSPAPGADADGSTAQTPAAAAKPAPPRQPAATAVSPTAAPPSQLPAVSQPAPVASETQGSARTVREALPKHAAAPPNHASPRAAQHAQARSPQAPPHQPAAKPAGANAVQWTASVHHAQLPAHAPAPAATGGVATGGQAATRAAEGTDQAPAAEAPAGFGGFGGDDDSDGSYDDAAW